MTRGQRAVLDVLADGTTFLSAQEIHVRLLNGNNRIGLTSVYRALQALTDDAVVDVVRQPSGELAYRRCATPTHHHHLVCDSCGAAVEVATPALERWVAKVAQDNGYTVTSHTLEVSGTCRACSTG